MDSENSTPRENWASRKGEEKIAGEAAEGVE